MEIYKDKRWIRCKAEQMFDIIADVERYSEFLSGWHCARILKGEGNIVYVDQEVGLGAFRTRFRTRAIFTRPVRIDISSTDDPFRKLHILWLIEPTDHYNCLLQFCVDFEIRSTLLKKIMEPLFSRHFRRIIPAFEERVKLVYSDSTEVAKYKENTRFADTQLL